MTALEGTFVIRGKLSHRQRSPGVYRFVILGVCYRQRTGADGYVACGVDTALCVRVAAYSDIDGAAVDRDDRISVERGQPFTGFNGLRGRGRFVADCNLQGAAIDDDVSAANEHADGIPLDVFIDKINTVDIHGAAVERKTTVRLKRVRVEISWLCRVIQCRGIAAFPDGQLVTVDR